MLLLCQYININETLFLLHNNILLCSVYNYTILLLLYFIIDIVTTFFYYCYFYNCHYNLYYHEILIRRMQTMER